MTTCVGSGKIVLKKDAWNIRNKNKKGILSGLSSSISWGEGWRTTCPDCGKVCAVGPTSHQIQKHAVPKSKTKKLSVAEKKIAKAAMHDLLYSEIYEEGLSGKSLRPINITDYETRQIWDMAYLDGLLDGGHNMRAGAFRRWLAKN